MFQNIPLQIIYHYQGSVTIGEKKSVLLVFGIRKNGQNAGAYIVVPSWPKLAQKQTLVEMATQCKVKVLAVQKEQLERCKNELKRFKTFRLCKSQ